MRGDQNEKDSSRCVPGCCFRAGVQSAGSGFGRVGQLEQPPVQANKNDEIHLHERIPGGEHWNPVASLLRPYDARHKYP
jgi:hypothetical protein